MVMRMVLYVKLSGPMLLYRLRPMCMVIQKFSPACIYPNSISHSQPFTLLPPLSLISICSTELAQRRYSGWSDALDPRGASTGEQR